MKVFLVIAGILAVFAIFKYGPDLYVKGLGEKNRLMTKMAEPFNERNADVTRLKKITTPSSAGTRAAGGGVKRSSNEILKQMKQQKKDLRNQR